LALEEQAIQPLHPRNLDKELLEATQFFLQLHLLAAVVAAVEQEAQAQKTGLLAAQAAVLDGELALVLAALVIHLQHHQVREITEQTGRVPPVAVVEAQEAQELLIVRLMAVREVLALLLQFLVRR
jgi:hypothetical protein